MRVQVDIWAAGVTLYYMVELSLLASHDKPFLLVGPSGTGKTVYIKVRGGRQEERMREIGSRGKIFVFSWKWKIMWVE